MTYMEKEILEQPTVLKHSFEINKEVFEQITKAVKERKIKSIVFSARGSSDNSGVYLKYMFEVYCKLPLSFAAPSVITVYKSDLDFSDALVIGVSQSGAAKDVLSVIEAANRQKALTLTITNYPESPLGKAGNYHLNLGVGEEKSVAATKTFTAQMYLLGCLAAAISGREELIEEFKNIPEGIAHVFDHMETIQEVAKEMTDVKDCFVLGRGFQYGITKEIALKLQETTYIKALSFAISDFYHGPLAMTDETSTVLMLAPNDETWENSLEMIEKLNEQKSNIIVFTDNEHPIEGCKGDIVLPKHSKHAFPFLAIVAAQLFALHVSLAKGLNPDVPRSLNKVTVTV